MCADSPELSDYKDTLHLPRTEFPMRAGLPNREPGWLERWDRIGIYDRLRERAGTRPPFVLHDGPPYANGHLHIGHGLNKTIKDMIVRSHQMMGHDSRYVPGWDCHGLPIEWKIEERYREQGRDKDDVPIVDFRQECRKFAEHWIDVQRTEFKRLGITGNWADPYLTMDFHAEAVIAGEFMTFLMNGTLYQGSKPVMWSPVEQTALAEAEVEYHDKESFTVWVKFRVVEVPGQARDAASADLAGADVVIWTTTPWTMPSNKAVVYGKDVSYGLYEITGRPEECWARIGDRYILADKMAADVLGRARLDDGMWRRLRDVATTEFEGLALAHPLAGAEGAQGEWDDPRDFRAADFVSDEEGTGFVHCAPSHGMEEYELYRDLGMLDQVITYNVMDDGSFRADLPFFGGKRILRDKPKKGDWEGDANAAVIAKLAEVGGLLARGRIKHSYPHSWRSKAPLIFRATAQWFISMDTNGLRDKALAALKQTRFVPSGGYNRLSSMIEHRPDWCISRQRAWGVPIAIFVHRETGDILRDEAVLDRIAAIFEAEGSDAWFARDPQDFLGDGHDAANWQRVDDIVDVWFESGSTHSFVLEQRDDLTWPAQLYLEGSDQHRGWFHSSLLESCGTRGRAPYEAVLTHGFVLDQHGYKMSKSKGNTVAPQDVVAQSGADILRLWVVGSDYTEDLRIGPDILKYHADAYRRLRNTLRYLLGALADFDPSERVEPAEMPELERWVLHRVWEIDRQLRQAAEDFDFHAMATAIHGFCNSDLSAFWFDVRKDSLYCDRPDSLRRRAVRTVMDQVFECLVTWLSPITCFTAEEARWARHGEEAGSVHERTWPAIPEAWRNDALAVRWAEIRRVRRVVTGALELERAEKRIGASLQAHPVVFVPAETADLLKDIDFADVVIASGVSVETGEAPADAYRLEEVPGIAVVPTLAEGEKCQRCWKVLPDVGTHDVPGVCGRCADAVDHLRDAAQ